MTKFDFNIVQAKICNNVDIQFITRFLCLYTVFEMEDFVTFLFKEIFKAFFVLFRPIDP